jgi:hypothetical protein
VDDFVRDFGFFLPPELFGGVARAGVSGQSRTLSYAFNLSFNAYPADMPVSVALDDGEAAPVQTGRTVVALGKPGTNDHQQLPRGTLPGAFQLGRLWRIPPSLQGADSALGYAAARRRRYRGQSRRRPRSGALAHRDRKWANAIGRDLRRWIDEGYARVAKEKGTFLANVVSFLSTGEWGALSTATISQH